jgi:hypothetical protein
MISLEAGHVVARSTFDNQSFSADLITPEIRIKLLLRYYKTTACFQIRVGLNRYHYIKL